VSRQGGAAALDHTGPATHLRQQRRAN
jgi:hypothetical protein